MGRLAALDFPLTASERQRAAVEALDVQPDDRILELGCGHGVAATLVCEQLGPDGHLLALDRSPKMIEAATSRNAAHVEEGRVTFICASFEHADLEGQSFDKVFGIHFPPADRHDPAGTRERVDALLAPGGIARWF
jgi:ubiquinone/menaquinone biosynthesis C-methylase UbiE